MNVLLINAPKHNFEPIFPFTLGYICSLLKTKGFCIFGIDILTDKEGSILNIIKNEDIDLVCIDVSLYLRSSVIELCRKIKKISNVKIVALGEYATLVGSKLLEEQKTFDYVIRGDPEYAFCELCDKISESKILIEGVIDKKNMASNNDSFASIEDLDSLPFPDRDIFPMSKYSTGMLTRNKLYAQIITSRGCNYKCSYCTESITNNPHRARSPKNIIDEIKYLADSYGVKEFHIEDKNFFSNNIERVKEICEQIKEELVPIEWQCPGVIPLCEFTDLSVIDAMSQAGCYSISLGVESFNDLLLKNNGRVQSSSTVEEILSKCRINGIELSCNLILGLPGQSVTDIKEDMRKTQKYPFDFVHYNVYTSISAGNNKCNKHDVSKYKYFQLLGNIRLLFKKSIIFFIIKRLAFRHNWIRFFSKMYYYFFKEKKLHIA